MNCPWTDVKCEWVFWFKWFGSISQWAIKIDAIGWWKTETRLQCTHRCNPPTLNILFFFSFQKWIEVNYIEGINPTFRNQRLIWLSESDGKAKYSYTVLHILNKICFISVGTYLSQIRQIHTKNRLNGFLLYKKLPWFVPLESLTDKYRYETTTKKTNKYSSLSLILINFVANTICCFSIHQNHFDVFSHFVSMKWAFGFGKIDVTLHIYSTIYRWYIGMIHPSNCTDGLWNVFCVCLCLYTHFHGGNPSKYTFKQCKHAHTHISVQQ